MFLNGSDLKIIEVILNDNFLKSYENSGLIEYDIHIPPMVEAISFNRRVVGSIPALAAM